MPRSAVTNEHAAAQMRAIFAAQVTPVLAAVVGPEPAALRRAGRRAAAGSGADAVPGADSAVTALTSQEIVDAITPAGQATLELGLASRQRGSFQTALPAPPQRAGRLALSSTHSPAMARAEHPTPWPEQFLTTQADAAGSDTGG